MPRITVSTVIKLLILSLCVGLLLAYLNLSPQDLFHRVVGQAESIFAWSVSVMGWAVSYVLLGAVVVVPIWLVLYLWRAFKGRR